MRWQVTTAPASLPLTWPQMKAQTKLVSDRDMSLVMDYVAAETAHAEELMQCSLVARTITATYDELDEQIVLARGPVLSIASVVDADGQNVTGYRTRYTGNRVSLDIPHRRARPQPITVVYVAGYAVVPADVVGWIRVGAATRYAYRESTVEARVAEVFKLDEAYRARGRGSVVA